MITEYEWLPTSRAASALGRSADTLKRKRDSQGGFLEHGYHYCLGDTRYDLDASRRAMLDFIFISGWSEINDQKSFIEDNTLHSVKSLKSLLSFT